MNVYDRIVESDYNQKKRKCGNQRFKKINLHVKEVLGMEFTAF